MKDLPSNTTELIDLLDSTFPHRCPRPGDSPEAIWMYAGKRELVDLLISKINPKPKTKGNYFHVQP